MAGFGPVASDLRHERPDLRHERLDLRPERLEKLRRGGDVRTYVTVHPCVLQDIGPLGPLPKKALATKYFFFSQRILLPPTGIITNRPNLSV